MGSRDPDPLPIPETADREVHILVTGFGPFASHATNPSHLIASSLPPQTSMYFPHPPTRLAVHIHTHPVPIRVSYKTVRGLIPSLLFPPSAPTSPSSPTSASASSSTETKKDRPNFDIVLFIGMASGRKYFMLESQAHRDGYVGLDVDGETMKGDEVWQGREFKGAPEVLGTGFEVREVWGRLKELSLEEDIRPSDDAGHYLCDFIYYTGLVEYWRRDPKGERPVAFLHVPGGVEEEDVVKGRTVAMELIRALVDSQRVKRGEGG